MTPDRRTGFDATPAGQAAELYWPAIGKTAANSEASEFGNASSSAFPVWCFFKFQTCTLGFAESSHSMG